MALIHILDKQTDDIIATLNSGKGEIKEALLFDSINNVSYFDFTATKKLDVLEKRNRVLVRNQDGYFNEFIITHAEQYDRNEKLIKANASYTDLSKARIINPTSLTGATPSTAAAFALSGTEWQPGVIEYTFSRTVTIEDYTDPYSLLKLIASTFELEITYRIEVAGNKITGRYVDMKQQAAGFEGKEIKFGKDLIGVKRIENNENIVTALQGIGPEREDGSRLTVIVEDDTAFQIWSRKGRHLIQTYEPQTEEENMTLERLRTLTENELQKRIESVISYECEAVSLEHIPGRSHEKIRKGQTVRIKDEGYTPPLYLDARIDDVEIDPLSNRVLNFKIGNFAYHNRKDLENQIMSVQKALQEENKMLKEQVQTMEEKITFHEDLIIELAMSIYE